LQEHYADAIPLELLKSEQERVTAEISGVQTVLKTTTTDAETLKTTAHLAVKWLDNGQATYEKMSSQERRLKNQAFFKRVWVTEEGLVGWEYNEPFATPMRAHKAPEPVVGAALELSKRSERGTARSASYARSNRRRAPGLSFPRGLKDITSAEEVGFEPTVA
jgi:hypothetical protein